MEHWYIPATIIPGIISALLGLIALIVYSFRVVKSGKINLITNVNAKK
jgi:hypothetical protein